MLLLVVPSLCFVVDLGYTDVSKCKSVNSVNSVSPTIGDCRKNCRRAASGDLGSMLQTFSRTKRGGKRPPECWRLGCGWRGGWRGVGG